MMSRDVVRSVDPDDVGRADRGAVPGDDAADREFTALLDRRDIRVVFQPLVDLRSGEIVGLEALARGPESTQFASPMALFAAARRAGRVAELDWTCRAAAFRAFLAAGAPPAMSLFVNVEPEALAVPCPADLAGDVAAAESILRVFVEVNDRALAADPAGVLAAVDRAREMGWGIAVDDVGASRAPVAMLPIVRADVIKLDLRRLDASSREDSCAIITSVLRHIERTGASLLVEGIESDEDARRARALGAVFGQGHHLGTPGPLRDHYPAPLSPVRLIRVLATSLNFATPFELLSGLPRQTMSLPDLAALAPVLVYGPRSSGTALVFLTCLGRDGEFPDEMLEHCPAQRALLFVAFGTNLTAEPVAGVRGVRLLAEDPLANERFHIVLSDHAPLAIFARPSPDGLYEVVVTQDPGLVLDIAHQLIRRVPEPGSANTALRVPSRNVEIAAMRVVGPLQSHRHSWSGRTG